MKIALVIGHDFDRQGAYGDMGQSEFAFNDELLSEMANDDMFPYKHEYGVFYRSADIKGYSRKMKDLHKGLDKWGADISMEFHFNAIGKVSVTGHEVLYCSSKGKKLAQKLDAVFDKNLNNKDRNIKKRKKHERGGGFLCRGKSTCIIIEPFFAAHQHKFISGGDMRGPLKKAFQEFFEEI